MSLAQLINAMKFPSRRKKVPDDNDDLVKPLLSGPKFQQPLFQEYEYNTNNKVVHGEACTKLFPPPQKRRSAIIRKAARRKSELKRFFGEGELSDDSEYTRFSFCSVGSTERTATLRSLTLASIDEEEEDKSSPSSIASREEAGKGELEDSVVHITTWIVFKLTLVFVVSVASVAFYAVGLTEEFAVESSVVSLTFLGVAGGISAIMAPWVCAKECRLAKSPGKFTMLY